MTTTLNKLKFKDGIVVFWFNNDKTNHVVQEPGTFITNVYTKFVSREIKWTYNQWKSRITKK